MTRLALVALALLAVPGTTHAACDGADNCLGIYFDQEEWTQTCYEPPLFMRFHPAAPDPRAYLTDVLNRISTHPQRRIAELTPRGWLAARTAASPAPTA